MELLVTTCTGKRFKAFYPSSDLVGFPLDDIRVELVLSATRINGGAGRPVGVLRRKHLRSIVVTGVLHSRKS